MICVCIDPGHGQDNRVRGVWDPGNTQGGWNEADLVLRYALRLSAECQSRGWSVVLTRPDTTASAPLGDRVTIAQRARADVLVSLHTNSATRPTGEVNDAANGAEAFYSISRQLAADLSRAVATALQFRDRGAAFDGQLAVLKTTIPAALVELGFQSNPGDRRVLVEAPSPILVAKSIADVLAKAIRPRYPTIH